MIPLLDRVRDDFPFLAAHEGRSYLDSAATSQRPRAVIDAETAFVETSYAAVHRGSSMATGAATVAYESARATVAAFVGARPDEIVWTENATDAINIVALGMSDAALGLGGDGARARFGLGPGDEILVTEAEHHANLLPWQRLAARTGAHLRWVPVDDRGLWGIDDLSAAVTDRTRLIAVAHVSNVTGLVAPVPEIADIARRAGALTVLDACQSVPHHPVDLPALGVDFAAFSSHKMLGPTGIGALWGRKDLLDLLPPARTGGSTITTVTMETAEFLPAPARFEAGTQPVSQAVGLAAASEYLRSLGLDAVAAHEREMTGLLVDAVAATPGVRLFGPDPGAERGPLVSFVVDGVHAHDVGQFLDDRGITVRTGHHCAQPLHRRLGVTATTRASAYVYTSPDDVARFAAALAEVRAFFGADR
jgi:cysteine desulfurase/selenocysteine lyase